MMRSMFSAVSGLRVHQTRMDVIANNIANVNTTGYKASRTTFLDVFNQTLSSASRADIERGTRGRNAMQIGLGANVASIDQIMTTGAAQRTDWAFDMMIQGEGFFIVQDADGNNFFTRAGAFRVDEAGNITNASGPAVMGWRRIMEDGQWIVDSPSKVVPMVIDPTMEFANPKPTFMMEFTGNLNVADGSRDGFTSSMAFYDSIGTRFIVDVTYRYNNFNGVWSVEFAEEAALASNPNITFRLPTGFMMGEYDDTRGERPAGLPVTNDRTLYMRFDVFGNLEGVIPSGQVLPLMPEPRSEDTAAQFTLSTMNNAMPRDVLTAFVNGITGYPASTDPPHVVIPDVPAIPLGTEPTPAAARLYLLRQGEITRTQFDSTAADVAAMVSDLIVNWNYWRAVELHELAAASAAGAAGQTEAVFTIGQPSIPPNVMIPRSDFGEILQPTEINPTMRTNGQIKLDFSALRQTGTNTNATATPINGSAPGRLNGFSVGEDGVIRGMYSNGTSEVLGQIAITQFKNPAGLEKVGGNIFRETGNSGYFDGIGIAPGTSGTVLMSGVLEMSNVDLSQEFSDMIVTQRGFQSNSRIMSTSDEMLQELVNLKR